MIRKTYLSLLLAVSMFIQLNGQSYSLWGNLYDDQIRPLASGTVVLLNPMDSTLEFFAVTNTSGHFQIRNIKEGNYLLQASFMGFKPLYSPIRVPRSEGPDLGDIILEPVPIELEGAEVVGEAVPLGISGDTIIYNAAAFKTKPDAVTEDLLKQLPGIEVDRAGNIKALGEDVNQLYVDGKEFFGNDPKVATRNIPADAIHQVQVYDKKSDDTEFTGIDDGTRDKTLNLELKEDMKRGVFGDVLGGYGTGNHYKTSAKAYHFTDRFQVAGLGMINNVNEYGFSFSDYMDFSGGMKAMMGGGGSAQIKINADNSFPINFGQPVNGLRTSGAAGLNLSYSENKNNRTYLSYLINGSDKELEESVRTEHYTEIEDYTTLNERDELSRDLTHRINFGLRRRIDTTHNLILEGNAALMYGSLASYTETSTLRAEEVVNRLLSDRDQDSDRLSGNVDGTYTLMFGKQRSTLKISASAALARNLEDVRVQNETYYAGTSEPQIYNQFQDNRTDQGDLSLVASYTRRMGRGFYISPWVRLGASRGDLDRIQGPLSNGMEPVDSLSPGFQKDYRWISPALNIQFNTEKSQLTLGLITEFGSMATSLNGNSYPREEFVYFTPMLSWDYSWKTGRKINLYYNSYINTPAASQLLPVVNNLNPLNIFYGNPRLSPEYYHRLMAHWLIFDQFSFTSLMVALSGGYTSNKINWSTTITEELVQVSTLTNVDWDYQGRLNLDFSTPIRKLGIKINLDMEGDWNRGQSVVNEVENIYNTFSQRYSFSADNRKKKKWDVESGLGVVLTHTRYDIQESLNNNYFNLSWFADLLFTPNETWNAGVTADITGYSGWNTDESILVPLLRAEVNYYFLAHKRGVLSLSAHDLLDKNQNVVRISELNFMRETFSNTMRRYVMLSFKYRLNKVARDQGLKIDMHRRH